MKEYSILGPIMIPDLKILRFHKEIGMYEVAITAETIAKYRERFHKQRKEKNIDIEHDRKRYSGATLTDSFLLNEDNRKGLSKSFEDLPNGTWMVEYSFDNESEYNKFLSLGKKGFSVSVSYSITGPNGKSYTVSEDFRQMSKLSDLLPCEVHVFGGSTGGAGKNEHGEAHFQIREKNTGKDLGKIFMPSLELWNKSSFKERVKLMRVVGNENLSNKGKKAMVRWLEENDNAQLKRCHLQWNNSNADNNRTSSI